jgi:hypothetical protein
VTREARGDERAAAIGLCASCRFVEVITSSKGSIFYRCRLSETDPAFPRYPALPVLACRGYRRAEASVERDT